MRKHWVGLAALFAAGSLVVGDAVAQRRGGRNGGRSRSSGSRSTTSRSASPSRSTQSPARSGRSSTSAAKSFGSKDAAGRLQSGAGSLEQHLGLNRSALGESAAARQGSLGQLSANYGSDFQPFSPAWYAQHPNAFQATHPHADAVAAATTTGLARFLAVPAASVTTTTTSSGVAAEEEAVASEADAAEARDLADTGSANPADDAEWMQIGVFALTPKAQTEPTRMVQLFVDPNGAVRGSHLDLLSNDVQEVSGSVDKQALRVAWSIAKGPVVFQSPLGDLTQPSALVTAFFPSGNSSSWKLAQANAK